MNTKPITTILSGALIAAGIAFAPASYAVCNECGTVTDVKFIKQQGEASGGGAVLGGIVGGVIGHQIGSGRGNTAATVAGAAGGAYAGHQIEKQARAHVVYDISIRMENGDIRRLTKNTAEGLRAGDHVEVTGSQITRTS